MYDFLKKALGFSILLPKSFFSSLFLFMDKDKVWAKDKKIKSKQPMCIWTKLEVTNKLFLGELKQVLRDPQRLRDRFF